MALKRTEHWATREFHQFLRARGKMPFKWGENDCALFAADGIQAMTGIDVGAPFRGRYVNSAGALTVINSVTGGHTLTDAAAWVATQHGLAELPHPLMAQRGDLVIVANGDQDMAGLVHLSGRHVVSVGEEGLLRICITKVKRAWRV